MSKTVAEHELTYHVTFHGGPADGLVIVADRADFPERQSITLCPPDVAADWQDSDEPRVPVGGAYRLTSKRLATVDGQPTVDCRYQFSGFDSSAAWAAARHGAAALHAPLEGSKGLLASLSRRMKRWMLAPVGYPLRVEAPAASGDLGASGERAPS